MNLDICYLLLFPYKASSPLGPLVFVQTPKDAPYFYDLDIELRSSWGEREMVVEETAVRVQLQVFDGLVWVAECHYTLVDGLHDQDVLRQERIQAALKRKIQVETETETADLLMEEYTVVILPRGDEPADLLLDRYASGLGYLLRSLRKPLSQKDAAAVLDGRAHYSKDETTAVDWAGAVIVCESDDFQSDIELLKIGKYQLLRYRLLDQTIHQMLAEMRQHLPTRVGRFPSSRKMIAAITEQRLSLLLDFEKIDQSLLLIGDWYSAQMYQLIVDRFGLDEWKRLTHGKLDNLSEINQIVQDNLAFSWRRTIDFIVFIGWFVMMVGYLVLFVNDIS